MGRFLVDLVAQGVTQSPVYADVENWWVAISLCLHGELHIPVKAIQVVKEPLQLLCFERPDNKGVMNIADQHSGLWVACAKALSSKSSMKKLVMIGESREPLVTPSVCL